MVALRLALCVELETQCVADSAWRAPVEAGKTLDFLLRFDVVMYPVMRTVFCPGFGPILTALVKFG
jgi:hypothetical protein